MSVALHGVLSTTQRQSGHAIDQTQAAAPPPAAAPTSPSDLNMLMSTSSSSRPNTSSSSSSVMLKAETATIASLGKSLNDIQLLDNDTNVESDGSTTRHRRHGRRIVDPASLCPPLDTLLSPHEIKSLSVPEQSMLAFQRRVKCYQETGEEMYHPIVYVKIRMVDVKKVDSVRGMTEVDFHMYLRWYDPAMVGVTSRQDFGRTVAEYESLWSPMIEINNSASLVPVWSSDVSWNFKDADTGLMKYSQRFCGRITTPLNLAEFPFDVQKITVSLGSTYFNSAKLCIKSDPDLADNPQTVSLPMTEWDCDPQPVVVHSHGKTVSSKDSGFCHMDYSITLRRNPTFYGYKVLLLNVLITVWCWSVFLMEPLRFEDRSALVARNFMSCLALLFLVNGDLPRVPYLTTLDRVVFWHFLQMFLAVAESLLAFYLASPSMYDNRELADRFDQGTFIFCAVFEGIMLVIFFGRPLIARHSKSTAAAAHADGHEHTSLEDHGAYHCH
jgi:Neurotransmitter-gated ion-channel ligand binding domain